MTDSQDESRVQLDPGDASTDVYPRAVYTKEGRASRMAADPAERYAHGSAKKTMTRYVSSLRNVVPIRKTKRSDVKGGAKIDESGLFSFVTYSWVFEYLFSAFKGKLDKDQVWNCSIYDASNVNMARMEVLWEDEQKRNPQSPSLFRALFRFIRTRLWAACGVFLFCLIFGFIGPTCLIRGLVQFAENPPVAGESINYRIGFFLVFAICLVEIARVLSYGATWAISYRTGIRVRGALLGLLFKRLLNARSLGKKNAAEIVNMFANDGQRLFDAVTFAPLVIIGPLVLIGGIAYLLVVVGRWSLLGILVFFIFDVIQYGLGKTMVRCRNNAIEKTEKRISLMGEIIRSIRVIKINCMEESFSRKIEQMRHAEKIDIRTAGYAQSLAIACGPVVPVVAAILTFLGVVLSGHDLLASDAFSAITVFFVMLFGIRMIPYGSRYLAEALVAVRRIQEILLYDQWEPVQPHAQDQNIAIRFHHATYMWSPPSAESNTPPTEVTPVNTEQSTFALDNITLNIRKKELTGICGAVGSGKSALLNSIIGHMYPVNGELEIGGTFAYVPQTPWIQNATVQENILFGSAMNSQRYYKAVSSCQLTKDMEALAAGDQTEIGERGATLSGGQKARVSLARALFAHKDIYLLDDVLASLDKKVGDKIFEKAVRDVLSTKTVLMVTSDPQRLSQCDRVVFMDNGRIVAHGEHEELLATCTQYKEYCESASVHGREGRVASPSDDDYDKVEDIDIRDASAKLISEDENKGRVVDDEEDLGLAAMSFTVYKSYIRAAGSWLVWVLLLAAFVLNISASIFSTFWLSRWLKTGHHEELVETNGSMRLHSEGSLADSPDTPYFSTVYGVSLVVLFLSGLLKAMIFVKVSLNAASRLHNGMFSSVIRGTVGFFDSTPTGRILNRFSKDMDEIDVKLPFTAEVFLQNMITCIGFLLVIAWVFPAFLIACIPLLAIFLLFVMCFRAGIRSLKRSENISRSPLFDHITTTIEGLACIHSYGQTVRFLETLKHRLDANSGAVFMFQSAMRWLAVWLDLLVVMITSIVAFFIVVLTGTISPADAGMALAFAVQMSGIFQFAVRTQTELEAKMTSVERVAYYSENIQSEGDWETKKGVDVPKEWPQNGQIDFQSVKLRYRPKFPLALNDVTFEIKPKEKIGVIGRTGSGKSSIGNVLYRLYPLTWGRIFIDGVDIATIGLHRLRKAMSVIPQDPVLFAGTIRSNLDPNNIFTDSEIWTALEQTYLKPTITNFDKKLEAEVASGGENFSVGERQLLCLARALLTKAKIVMLDEATASLDMSTDKLIQKAIREVFVDATVILIAHRLENVYGLDRVLMMDGGKVVEFDRPEVLLSKTASELQILARETGRDEILVESEGAGSESSPELMEKPVNGDSESTPEIINKDVSPDSVSIPEMVEKQESEGEEDDSVEILDRPEVNQSSVDDDDLEMLNVPPKT
ncbi:ABC transporter, ATP-binding protein [Teladorsagia circumcincta]|uniref:ABC transporter, ATP-binding protein n=2 Tax=Teladorsagia circumcincta TaxID=45464 RepID=A0A2G9UB57_TELCI|nr:ABC transporter, ATP-binding protein [Teladorsagia circumcincta]